ncbi:PucR family transcriptional regulator ligand-binding domain-containing protein [Paeniglutamicibacter sp. ABSL32-1]|uniref:PucR family transcriptional regulator n=1 Tax=Paeniglutamicibacter quisquiliarum TaxID=2849498 RepID=UPI001C2DB1E8|nr:PucR family transcriptional regulator [Paeniglutamicibacter quisquiliarum]MBV1779860.1 PucR family transcriptional regulator ligand-binding domain-containing protein [Paeniglutamicibacter quisquiliarum]
MAITLLKLLESKSLGLKAHTDFSAVGETPIEWAAVTELRDPSPFLTTGAIVLTTGLRQTTIANQESFVRTVHAAGVLALGYGTGLSHRSVPAAVIREATELGLPVFEVPYETPFMAITKLIADALNADHLQRLEQLLKGHQQLASTLLTGGLRAMLHELSRMLGTAVALTQFAARIHGPELGEDSWHEVPIATGLRDKCTLHLAEPYGHDGLVDYAQGLIGLELANQSRLRESTRLVAGQAFSDLLAGTLTGSEANARLQGIGVAPSQPHSVVLVAAAPGQEKALRTLPVPPEFDYAVSAIVDDRLALVVALHDGAPLADGIDKYLQGAGIGARVGFGGGYTQPNGLRWSFFEAIEALRHGERLNTPSKLSLTSLLLAARDVPLHALAQEALEPLQAFDKKHSAELLGTLRSYLELDGSVGAVADALGLHRNTVRYRLQQISELSGYDPTKTADRVQLWLALTAMDLN